MKTNYQGLSLMTFILLSHLIYVYYFMSMKLHSYGWLVFFCVFWFFSLITLWKNVTIKKKVLLVLCFLFGILNGVFSLFIAQLYLGFSFSKLENIFQLVNGYEIWFMYFTMSFFSFSWLAITGMAFYRRH